MSAYEQPDPYVITPFNSEFYGESSTGNITLAYANATYYKKTGGILNGFMLATSYIETQDFLTVPQNKFIIGSTAVLSTGTQLNYLSGVTLPGTAYAGSALVLDSSLNIATINSLTTNTLICNTQFNNLGNATYSGTNSTILFTGNSTLINMTGSASRITISGANSDIYLSGTNAHIDLLNTAASNNINTGAIRCAGGAYFGNDSVFNTQITIGSSVLNSTNAGYLTSISAGTVSSSKCIVVDVNKDISNFRHLGMTGIFTCDIINSSGIYTNSNITNSTNYTSGSVQLAGGMSITKSLYVNSNIQTSSYLAIAGSLTGVTFIDASGYISTTLTTDSTSTSSGALIIDGGAAIKKTLYIGGKLYCVDTSVSTTSTSNSVQFSGGLYTAKAILNNSYYNCNTINSSATSQSTSLQAICLNDHAIYFRGQNSSDTNHGLMYSKNASWNSGNGFASANIDGPVLYGYGGVLIGNLNSSGSQVECAKFVGTLATIKTKLIVNTSSTNDSLLIGTSAIASPGAQVGINSLGQHIRLIYNNSAGTETVYGILGVGASGQISLTPVSGATSTIINILPTGFMNLTSSNTTPRYNLDFGSTAANVKICLYEPGTNIGTQGLGCSSTDMYYLAQTSHKFYKSSTNGSLTTLLTTIDSNGISVSNNGNVNITKDTYGFNHKSGSGVDIYTYANSNTSGAIGTYSNHDFFLYTNNSSKLYITAAGLVGIGTTTPTCNLHVVGTSAQSNPFTFGYLSNAGAGTSTGFTNRQFSIRTSGGILCDAGEIDVFSDIRMKKDIENLNLDICNKFIDNIQPISFKYIGIENDKTHYGFNAQELMKYGFTSLVGGSYDEHELLKDQIIECDNGKSLKISENTRLVVSMLDMIPILMNVIKEQKKELTDLKTTVNNLVKVLTPGSLKKFQVLIGESI